jgi:hypothetical protein
VVGGVVGAKRLRIIIPLSVLTSSNSFEVFNTFFGKEFEGEDVVLGEEELLL